MASNCENFLPQERREVVSRVEMSKKKKWKRAQGKGKQRKAMMDNFRIQHNKAVGEA